MYLRTAAHRLKQHLFVDYLDSHSCACWYIMYSVVLFFTSILGYLLGVVVWLQQGNAPVYLFPPKQVCDSTSLQATAGAFQATLKPLLLGALKA